MNVGPYSEVLIDSRALGLKLENYVPVAENWMLGMCDVADCINDVRDPETIRFRISKILKLKLRLSSLLLNSFIL